MISLRRNLSVDVAEVAQGRGIQPGEYVKIHDDNPVSERFSGIAWALTCCPGCGKVWTLAKRVHTVGLDGIVTPSLVCPNPSGCPFHDFVKLEGWEL